MRNSGKGIIALLVTTILLFTPILAYAQGNDDKPDKSTPTATATATPESTVTETATVTLTPTLEPSPTATNTPTPVPAPTLSASPTTVVAGNAVTVTWANIPNPTAKDWIGLYQKGGTSNQSQQAWLYVSGTKNAGKDVPPTSGSVSFTIPANLDAGNYEFRLFSDDSYDLLATSNSIAVTAASPTATATPGPTNTPTATATPTDKTSQPQVSVSNNDWQNTVVPTPTGDRQANHGWFVSWIAQFAQTLDDVRHGLVVSFFAHSDEGKEVKPGDVSDQNRPSVSKAATATATTQPTDTPTATTTPVAEATTTPTATTTSNQGKHKGSPDRTDNRGQGRSGADEDNQEDDSGTQLTASATATPTATAAPNNVDQGPSLRPEEQPQDEDGGNAYGRQDRSGSDNEEQQQGQGHRPTDKPDNSSRSSQRR